MISSKRDVAWTTGKDWRMIEKTREGCGSFQDLSRGSRGKLPGKFQEKLQDMLRFLFPEFRGFLNVPWRKRAFGPGTKYGF